MADLAEHPPCKFCNVLWKSYVKSEAGRGIRMRKNSCYVVKRLENWRKPSTPTTGCFSCQACPQCSGLGLPFT